VGCGPARSPHRWTKCNSPPVNGQSTNSYSPTHASGVAHAKPHCVNVWRVYVTLSLLCPFPFCLSAAGLTLRGLAITVQRCSASCCRCLDTTPPGQQLRTEPHWLGLGLELGWGVVVMYLGGGRPGVYLSVIPCCQRLTLQAPYRNSSLGAAAALSR